MASRWWCACPVEPFLCRGIDLDVAEKSLSTATPLISDGPGYFNAVKGTGMLHEPYVSVGGASSAKHSPF
jgi:hypothetical protein